MCPAIVRAYCRIRTGRTRYLAISPPTRWAPAYGAHMLHVMRQTVDVDAALASGDLSPINGWLCEHIWQYGGLYEPETLLSRALGEPFDPMYYVNYLKNKYSEIYGLA